MVKKTEAKVWLDPTELDQLDDLVRARGSVAGRREKRSTVIRDFIREGIARQRSALGLDSVAVGVGG